jgi:hypothetical protein
MSRILIARVVLAIAGVATWGYGVRYDLRDTRIAGIAILVVCFILRFAPGRSKPDSGDTQV